MSRLRDRLERRRKGREPRSAKDAPEAPASQSSSVIDQLRRKMERVAARHAPRTGGPRVEPDAAAGMPAWAGDGAAELPGEVVETGEGPVLRVRETYPPGTLHGREPADGFLDTGAGLAVLARNSALADLPPTSALFIDTETTGLAGGTGTLPFLIGVGWSKAAR